MARAWLQYDSASQSWVDWPAGTLPSPESIFRAAFLNQFVGWAKYVNNYYTFNNVGTTPNYVSPGDVIQSAAFWNALNFDPTLQANGYQNLKSADMVAGYEFDYALLRDNPALPATAFDPVSAGDVIQPRRASDCPMRNRLLKLRTRLDLFQVTWNFAMGSTGYTSTAHIYSNNTGWSTYSAVQYPVATWQDYYSDGYPFYGWQQGQCRYNSSVRVARFTLSSPTVQILSAPHGAAWVSTGGNFTWWNETAPPLVPLTKDYRVEATTPEIGADGWNAGTLGLSSVSPRDHGPYTMLASLSYAPHVVLLDALPELFRPAEYPFPE